MEQIVYRQYFDIDPEYFPQVDKRIIETEPELWKKFYPHDSFKQLLKTTVDAIQRKNNKCIWVDGAYGTGKSHAVLTIKKIIEASEQETTAYFKKYDLDSHLLNDLISAKSAGNILVCHRYGSSDINNDTELFIAIQDGIEKALKEAGIENKAALSLKNALIRFFENDENKQSFDIFAKGSCRDILGGDLADDVIHKLKTYNDSPLRELISKLFKVQIIKSNYSMTASDLCDWIREVLSANGLTQIMYIWDEFSEYFTNNVNHLTGFQEIAELSATSPFCLMIVTHKAEAYFSSSDPDKKKILDRFSSVHISLPENIAFELMGEAMQITKDEDLAKKWEKDKEALNARTMQSRQAVSQKIHVELDDLSKILPIHPYTALILQHISIYYTSTARSMFTYIKGDDENAHAFQWFIDNYGFNSPNPFVTVDMLWGYFHDANGEKLAGKINEILNCYTPKYDKELSEPEQRVLKTILLLQAISEGMGGGNSIFSPNKDNLALAFEGSDIQFMAIGIADKLLENHVVTRTPLTGEKFSYCCRRNTPGLDVSAYIDQVRKKTTKEILNSSVELRNVVELPGALRLRYTLDYATITDFDAVMKRSANPADSSNKLHAVVAIARDNKEGAEIQKKIRAFYDQYTENDVVVIDATNTGMSEELYENYVNNYATALAIGTSDIQQRKTYEGYAQEALKKWAGKISDGSFYVYSRFKPTGFFAADASFLTDNLKEINKYNYSEALESFFINVLNTMFDATQLKAGALCGIKEEPKGTFRSGNDRTKLEKIMEDVWQVPDYKTTKTSYIAVLKRKVDALIEERFKTKDKISISEIYDFFKEAPYGFMPCNLTAFVLGFLLKEYANPGYTYSDDVTSDVMSEEHLANMIDEIIKQQNSPSNKYRDKYIVAMTKEEKSFNHATAQIFSINESSCVSIVQTRTLIREKMKNYSFPIWLLEYSLDSYSISSSKDQLCEIINYYCGIANNQNIGGDKSDTDIALSIGRACLAHPEIIDDLKSVLSKDNCKRGMLEYLRLYRGGALPSLAREIGDNGQYINHLEYKFNSDAANWVWNKETVHQKIDELITEYEIVNISNKVLTKHITYHETITAWKDKIDQICVAFSVIKLQLGENRNFFEQLYQLKMQGQLLDSQKAVFLESLKTGVDSFKGFMESQARLLLQSLSYELEGLDENDVDRILSDDNFGFRGSFVNQPNQYSAKLQTAVKEYKNSLASVKLKKKWQELTNSDSPFEWSQKYRMPITAMVSDNELPIVRGVFATINSGSSDENRVNSALDHLERASYIASLNSQSARDAAFVKMFLKDYDVILKDIEEVKRYISGKVSDQPYYWTNSGKISAAIDEIAKAKYNGSAYDTVKSIIDSMSGDDAKQYLETIIQSNMKMGIEILKDKLQ